MSAKFDRASLQKIEDAMDAVIATFLETGVDQAHLARIKTQVAASDIYEKDDQSGLARTYGAALTAGLTVEDVQSWSSVLQSVTEEDIMAAARKVLNINNSVTGWMVPPKEEDTK